MSQIKDWPHAPVHRFDSDGIYMITGATLHKKAIFHQSRLSAAGVVAPPYGKAADLFIKMTLGR